LSQEYKLCLTIQYDGSVFHGWQRQKGLATVQETLERAINKLTKMPCTLEGAGRTDAGVHALGQRAHLTTSSPIPLDKWCLALNSLLPAAVRVVAVQEVDPAWHARFTPHFKHYRYTIDTASIPSPLGRLYRWQRRGELSWELLNQSALLVVGEHNFKAFCASGSKVQNFVRTISHSGWEAEEELLHYNIVGNGFLFNMVRLLVGAMCDIASDKWRLEDMALALARGERQGTIFCAPPQGLCLQGIIYENIS